MKHSELSTQEIHYPDEYLKKADELIEIRELKEAELRKNYTPIGGRDDRLSLQLRQLDLQLRADIAELRKHYHLNSDTESDISLPEASVKLGDFEAMLKILESE